MLLETMKTKIAQLGAILTTVAWGISTVAATKVPALPRTHFVRAIHLTAPDPSALPELEQVIRQVFPKLGINTLIFEVDYRFAWKSHPELRMGNSWTYEQARRLAQVCRKHHIRLIPEFNCLGHQSWRQTTFPLLKQYREFDETPDIPLNNPGIYCRSWCPSHPGVMRVVSALLGELIDAFQADALHVGMDEVFLIAYPRCPRCHGKDPALLFAKAVNDLHRFLVEQKGVEMWMWSDRLLDAKKMGYSKWEASENGTWPAIDRIPKDIVLCDWHYGKRKHYPSIPYFLSKGFRVLPAGWRDEEAALAFIQDALRYRDNPRMLGYLATTWTDARLLAQALLGKEVSNARTRQVAQTLRRSMQKLVQVTRLDMHLRLDWSKDWLTVQCPYIPGGKIRIHYLEAYCRSGSTDADWVQHTVIPHQSRLIERDPTGRRVVLEDRLANGVTVRHEIEADQDTVRFTVTAENPTDRYADAQWAQPCVRVGPFTGHSANPAEGDLEDYLPWCFLFLNGELVRMPTHPWATQARYTPGQVWAAPGVPRSDLNPRPLSPLQPSLGLIGCFSAKKRWILATAWDPWQELFQGVARCIHVDFRIGGLAPHQKKTIRGRLYLLPADVNLLRARYALDFEQAR